MRRFQTKYQLFGDLNRQLNAIRSRMNRDVSEAARKRAVDETRESGKAADQ